MAVHDPVEVSASDLRNGWHDYLDQVAQGRQEIVVTRYGRPVARLMPYNDSGAGGSIFGCLPGSVTVHGDIVAPIDDPWDAEFRERFESMPPLPEDFERSPGPAELESCDGRPPAAVRAAGHE